MGKEGLDDLLRYNNERYKGFIDQPFFQMISSGDLHKDEKKRHCFFNHMQIFADHFQTMIYARQATCQDNRFYPTFLEHLKEEMDHDSLLRDRKEVKTVWDPVLAAVATWFTYQMLALDNVEKAALMHLVLETAGEFYHRFSDKVLGVFLNSDYYEIHAETDEKHVAMIIDLLKGYPAFVYQRLYQLLGEGWDMINTMVSRVYTLVNELTPVDKEIESVLTEN